MMAPSAESGPTRPPAPFRLALVSMPWAIFNRPSIQLGALKAWLDSEEAIETRTLHPYLQVAKELGPDTYHHLAQTGWAAEALYSPLLFPQQYDRAARLFHQSCRRNRHLAGLGFDQGVRLLDQALDRWLTAVDLSAFDLVGFSICFNQLLASLTAAARIRNRYPDLPIVVGGSGCVGAIGASLLETFTQLDYVISGEGEEALARLCHCLRKKEDPKALPARIIQRGRPYRSETGPGVDDLNRLPIPDYGPYFEQMRQFFPDQPFLPVLPLEFSRGCWWNRCAFCNLNLQWQGYRWKQGARVATEVREQAARHGCLDFTFTDNALPPGETDLFFETMAKEPADYAFFAEIRVITDGRRLAAWRRGGLSSVQVGIESLSSSLLARMRKGTTAMDNIGAMKEALACKMRLEGNLITEFPGSTEEEVAETLQNLDFVLPFTPLSSAAFFLGAGSPVSDEPGAFGVSAILPHPKNRCLFPREVLADLRMLINGYRGDRRLQRRLWQPVIGRIAQWQAFHAHRDIYGIPALSYRDGGSFLVIRQERLQGPCLHHRLRGTSREIYLFCQQIRSRADLTQQFPAVSPNNLDRFLTDLTAKRLLFQEKERVLALAIPASSR